MVYSTAGKEREREKKVYSGIGAGADHIETGDK